MDARGRWEGNGATGKASHFCRVVYASRDLIHCLDHHSFSISCVVLYQLTTRETIRLTCGGASSPASCPKSSSCCCCSKKMTSCLSCCLEDELLLEDELEDELEELLLLDESLSELLSLSAAAFACMIIFGMFLRCSRKSSVKPPRPMEVKKLIANLTFFGVSRGMMPWKYSAMLGSFKRSLSLRRPSASESS